MSDVANIYTFPSQKFLSPTKHQHKAAGMEVR